MDKDQVLEIMERDARAATAYRLEAGAESLAGNAALESIEARDTVTALYNELNSLRASFDAAGAIVKEICAERDELRAMRKRVEGLADEWTPTGWSGALSYGKAARELRAALGDSHE